MLDMSKDGKRSSAVRDSVSLAGLIACEPFPGKNAALALTIKDSDALYLGFEASDDYERWSTVLELEIERKAALESEASQSLPTDSSLLCPPLRMAELDDALACEEEREREREREREMYHFEQQLREVFDENHARSTTGAGGPGELRLKRCVTKQV